MVLRRRVRLRTVKEEAQTPSKGSEVRRGSVVNGGIRTYLLTDCRKAEHAATIASLRGVLKKKEGDLEFSCQSEGRDGGFPN